MKEALIDLISSIYQTQDIPMDWLHANIYPILKPKPWCCNLNNTCLITLLETAQKLSISILNTRLANIFLILMF